ncbi:MAG: SUMF1/EgtB/PvdO family nonheme iron enzyme [Bacteroidaceae bacterium]|nr:SUMF1/EgtB/PvdO family nonheme iron enzyme [Bacteroidaceae bacterium]
MEIRMRLSVLLAALFMVCVLSAQNQGTEPEKDIDTSLPVTETVDENTYVVIISNENYKHEVPVPFALNDGAAFKTYCHMTLGIPEENIKFVPDASLNDMNFQLSWLEKIMKVNGGKARAIFYYSGHGMPDEESKKAYLLPVDGYATYLESGLSTEVLYKRLGAMPSRGTIAFLDACFSGSKREGGTIVEARSVALKPKAATVNGNVVSFSAATGTETAFPYKTKEHGMFTYYLLRKLNESGGAVTLGELTDYVSQEVGVRSMKENSKPQTPTVSASETCADWRSWKLAETAATKTVNIPRPTVSAHKTVVEDLEPSNKPKPIPVQSKGLDVSAGGAFLLAGVMYDLVRIDKGMFMMGSKEGLNGYSTFSLSQPVHQVVLDAYVIGKTEVTQELWQAVMGSNPSSHKGAKLPVENVSWDDVQEFIEKLNEKCGTRFRLPTEAEWEYAADGRDDKQSDSFSGITRPDAVAHIGDATADCGSKKASAIGLQDMTGNVAEWCHDNFGRYPSARVVNPKGPREGVQRVVRGGSFQDAGDCLRNSFRGHMRPSTSSPTVGFRLAHSVE